LGQDPVLWTQRCLADIFIPLDFTEQDVSLRDELQQQCASAGNGVKIAAGLGVYSQTSEMGSAADLARQIQTVRELKADGFLLWHSHSRILEEQYLPGLQFGALRSPTRLPWHPSAQGRIRRRPAESAKPPRHRASMSLEEC
jgi:hypothetical protein